MSLDDLEREIAHEASKKAKELASQADSQAEALLAEARRKVEASKAEFEVLAREKTKGMYGELESSVYVQCKDALLEGIEHNVDEYFADAKREILSAFRRGHYFKFLTDVAKDAKAVFADYNPSDVVVEGNKQSVLPFRRLGYKVKSTNIEGVRLSSKDGKVTLDATLSGLIENNMEMIRNRMASTISGKASALNDVEDILAIVSGKEVAHTEAQVTEEKTAKRGRPPGAARKKAKRGRRSR
jgi:vacuolar-type H+-ATPase subunit E/Vma4